MKEHHQKIIKAIEFFRYQKDTVEVFKDLMQVMALRTSMVFESRVKWNERAKAIKQTLDRYDTKGKAQMEVLHGLVVDMLKESIDHPGDHLGEIYMGIIPPARAKGFGQFFSPYHLSYMMAEMQMEDCEKRIQEQGRIKINDCAVGAGGMLCASVHVLHKKGINYLHYAEFHGEDIDIHCCYMSYLQLAFLGTASVITHRNTLTMESWDRFITPGFFMRGTRMIPLDEEEKKLLGVLATVQTFLQADKGKLNIKKSCGVNITPKNVMSG